MRTEGRRRGLEGAAVLGAFALVSFVIFGLPVVTGHGQYVGVGGPDAKQFMWFLEWWPHAAADGINPLFTHVVFAPTGYNLTWTTSIPGPSLLAAPLTGLFGPAASYDIIAVLAPALSGWAGYLVCRRVTGRLWPSVLGGYLFGFSTYTIAELQGHLNLFLAFPVALCVYLLLRRLDGSLGPVAFVLLEATALLGEFSISTEVFATMTLFGALALLVAALTLPAERRPALLKTLALLAASYGIALMVCAPYLYEVFAHGIPAAYVHPTARSSADLLAFVVPTSNTLVGNDFAPSVTTQFQTNLVENGVYVGLLLLGIVVHFAVSRGRSARAKLMLLVPLGLIVVASLGPRLRIGGHDTVWMPWSLVQRLPLVDKIVPVRFGLYVFLIAAIVVAMWLSVRTSLVATRWVVAIAACVSILPNLPAGYWHAPLEVPAFFSQGVYRRVLSPGETTLVIPYRNGIPMLWQAETAMYYRTAGGYLGAAPPEFAGQPIVQKLNTENVRPLDLPQLREFLRAHAVTAIVVGPGGVQQREWRALARGLRARGTHLGGVDVYRLPVRGEPGPA